MITFVIIVKPEEIERYLYDCIKSLPNYPVVVCITEEGKEWDLTDVHTEGIKTSGKIIYPKGKFDFSKARNLAKMLAETEYIFSIDADERFPKCQEKEFTEFINNFKGEGAFVWNFSYFNPEIKNDFPVGLIHTLRIFRNIYRWEYKAHEQILIDREKIEITPFLLIHEGYKISKDEYAEKLKRNILNVAQELESKHSEYFFDRLINEATHYNKLRN